MTFPPPPPPPEWGAPPPPPPPWAGGLPITSPPSPPRWRAVVGIVAVSVLVLGLVAVATRVLGGDSGPDHPQQWDARVLPIANFVQDERGLLFDHPVYVDFLSPADYTASATDDEASVTEDDREDLERYAAELRAMGVGSGEIDLFTAYNQVSDAGTLAFYDPTTERITVRGTEMTVGLEVTLAHEITHALQDQHFDLEQLRQETIDSSAAIVFRALAEGDATRVEEGYKTSELTAEEQAAYEEEYQGEIDASEEATADVPPFVSATFGAPYALGQPFAVMLANQGGNPAVDDAFVEPPTTEESIFDPASFLANEGEEELDLGFDEDQELFDPGPFGATTWYLVLAERIDPKVAFEAALGWNGDDYASFERDGVTCVRTGFIGDEPSDEDEMKAAIDLWVAAMPGGQATSREIDGHPGLEACDPGEDVDMKLTGRSDTSLYLPSLWGFLIADAASELEAEGTRCYARRVLDGLTFEQITDPDGVALQGDAVQASLVEAFQACRDA